MYLGPAGSGQIGKAVNQVILAGSLLGVAEGVALARRSGIDADQLIAGIQRGAAASWVLSNRSDMMLSGDFTPKGRLALHHKDLLIAQQLARTVGVTLPGVDLVTDLESRAIHRATATTTLLRSSPRSAEFSPTTPATTLANDQPRSIPTWQQDCSVMAYRLSGSNLPAICLRNAYAEMMGLWYWR